MWHATRFTDIVIIFHSNGLCNCLYICLLTVSGVVFMSVWLLGCDLLQVSEISPQFSLMCLSQLRPGSFCLWGNCYFWFVVCSYTFWPGLSIGSGCIFNGACRFFFFNVSSCTNSFMLGQHGIRVLGSWCKFMCNSFPIRRPAGE